MHLFIYINIFFNVYMCLCFVFNAVIDLVKYTFNLILTFQKCFEFHSNLKLSLRTTNVLKMLYN